jgi:hypothetical protein
MTRTVAVIIAAALATGVSAPLAKDITAQAKDDTFIFSSNSVVSALDARQSLRLGERLSLAQIKRRLPSYTVEKSHECEGDCIHVSGKNGVYLELDYNLPGKPISRISGFLGSRDILGHIIGMSLIKAIGSTTCDFVIGMNASCASRSINNLSYDVNDDRCPEEDKITAGKGPTSQSRVAECMTADGMSITDPRLDVPLIPQFQAFSVGTRYAGPAARPNLSTPQAREYRTRLMQAASERANFSGHYILVQWGCGTACVSGAVVDAISGKVTFFPFGYVCCWRAVSPEFRPINFRANSRLIIFSGQLHEEGETGTHYFTFDNGYFKFLKTIPLAAEVFPMPQ